MSAWLLIAPSRDDDAALAATRWISEVTRERATPAPRALLGHEAVRGGMEEMLRADPSLRGVAFFGHGAEDRLFGADRAPGAPGPSRLDAQNVALLDGRWVHAFACLSGLSLARRAARAGAEIFVGYRRPLDAGWSAPPSAPTSFADVVTSTTLALLQGQRDERELRANVSRAVDVFFEDLESVPDDDRSPGWMWLYALAQQLVDDMVVETGSAAP
ncbi:MAG: hypothetical protein R3A48_01540 [Polyangiales bacterium]